MCVIVLYFVFMYLQGDSFGRNGMQPDARIVTPCCEQPTAAHVDVDPTVDTPVEGAL